MKTAKRINNASIIVGGILTGVLGFLFLHLAEILLSALVYKYKFSPLVLHYTLVYLIMGGGVGLLLGAAAVLLSTLAKKQREGRYILSPGFLFPAGFVCIYAVVVWNAHLVSDVPLLSVKSLLWNAVLMILAVPTILLFCDLEQSSRYVGFFSKAISTTFSMAVALTVLHFVVTLHFDPDKSGLILTGVTAYAYILLPFVLAGVEGRFTEWFVREKSDQAKGRIWIASAAIKFLSVFILVAAIFHARNPQPIEALSEKDPATLPKDAPNIILMVLDTVRQDRISVYGNNPRTTPNIEEFAEEATVFDAYATSHWTLPSHASLVTGLYPTENGTGIQKGLVIDRNNETLAEILAQAGYTTGAVIANITALGKDSGLPQGFDYYFTDRADSLPPVYFWAGYFLAKFDPESPVFLFSQHMRAASVNRRALKWIRKSVDRPFFLLLNYMDAHHPYVPPPPYDRMGDSGGSRLNLFSPPEIYIKYRNEVNAGLRHVTDEEHDYLVSKYDGEISYLDDQIGKLFQELKKLGLYENSLIIITSDHGEFFGEHDLVGHAIGSLYQEVIRVPLIVKFPDRTSRPAAKPSGPVSLVHLFHSILNSAEIPHKSGRQDVDIFGGGTAPILAECHKQLKRKEGFGKHTYCLIDENMKLTVSSNGREELFDLGKDPLESDNLKERPLPEMDRAYQEKYAYLSQEIKQLNVNALQTAEVDADTLDRIREQLRAVGYLQ